MDCQYMANSEYAIPRPGNKWISGSLHHFVLNPLLTEWYSCDNPRKYCTISAIFLHPWHLVMTRKQSFQLTLQQDAAFAAGHVPEDALHLIKPRADNPQQFRKGVLDTCSYKYWPHTKEVESVNIKHIKYYKKHRIMMRNDCQRLSLAALKFKSKGRVWALHCEAGISLW